MKHEQKLKRGQKIMLSKNGLDPADFFAIKAMGTGWLFRSRANPDTFLVCYTDRPGIFKADGTTPMSEEP